MICTVTFNPSLDYVVDVPDFVIGKTNRTDAEALYPGGKGINVSMVLKNLGIDSSPLGFIAGFTGQEIIKMLKQRGIKADFIQIGNGYSRINVKLRSEKETEINGQGPDISEADIETLYSKLDSLKKGDYLILAGSIPKTMPQDAYELIAKRLEGKGVKLIVDATKNLLVNVLPYHPFLIKPNNHELAEIFNVELNSNEDIVKYARKLQEMGAQNVIISMAGDGAIFIPEEGKAVFLPAPKGTVVNSVGAGDSLVAGFTAGVVTGKTLEESFEIGVATGSATAFSELLAEKGEVEKLLETLPSPTAI